MTTGDGRAAMRSPSGTLFGWILSRRLHKVTWLVVLAAALHLAGDTVLAISSLQRYFAGGVTLAGRATTLAEVLAGIVHAYSYSLLFFGTAASVEFLFRIWDEVRRRRT